MDTGDAYLGRHGQLLATLKRLYVCFVFNMVQINKCRFIVILWIHLSIFRIIIHVSFKHNLANEWTLGVTKLIFCCSIKLHYVAHRELTLQMWNSFNFCVRFLLDESSSITGLVSACGGDECVTASSSRGVDIVSLIPALHDRLALLKWNKILHLFLFPPPYLSCWTHSLTWLCSVTFLFLSPVQ